MDVPADDDWLSDRERGTLAGLHVPKRRADWRLGRWAAKEAVRAHLGTRPPPHDTIEVRPADDGAPEVWCAGEPAPVAISITHRGARAVVVAAEPGVAVGCDLELVEPRRAVFLDDFFTPTEAAAVRATAGPASGRSDAALVTRLWAAKEATLKALREGLRIDTKRLEVEPPVPGPSGAMWMPIAVRVRVGPDRRLRGWWRTMDDALLVVVTDPPTDAPRAL